MKWLDKLLGVERLNLGQPCKWEDIEVGEVLGVEGCFNVGYKVSETEVIHLADDWGYGRFGDKFVVARAMNNQVYKLPKETQELWLP